MQSHTVFLELLGGESQGGTRKENTHLEFWGCKILHCTGKQIYSAHLWKNQFISLASGSPRKHRI